ncbi:LLM class flavin-dependent oxidoreductase [Aeromicrobium choanae]|uniref:FAD/FMN-containing dehydrogenase n=1 Tax=Aeromicrobium choanae TaxID=1736691 RepID=A0A1T4Z4P6_9ACTN|nr:FAD-binding protein [Aeromicrobium choanae]SKB08979.1 FAD/FMN-containing dehydrogenase [Aeromicrobium choanae]
MSTNRNYGHPLRFGVETSTPAEQGHDVALLVGEDVDALTLAAWSAARTENVVLAPRIAVGDRSAAMIARAAGSLQSLSDGRAEVVLESDDADAVVDAVEAVRALEVDRPVPVWLQGTAAETVALAGGIADGLVIDLDALGTEGLAELNAALDRAAIEAGRDVREVRRAVTLSEPAVDDLITLVVEHGISSFVLRSGAVDEALARAVRAGAERALPPGALSARPVRRADVRALRRPGIGYDLVPEGLAETAVEPGDPAFASVRSTYLRGGDPGLVLRPSTVDEVVSAIEFARTHRHLPLGIRSGGHGISGRSTNDGGLVIDLGRLDEITVLDEERRLVRIGPGARWRDVATALQPHGWALSSGDYGGVGVGGLATAGGIGFLGRKHGLTIDHLTAVEMVLADGTLVRASADENPELFWAARGAGANFGVAVAFEFVVDEVGDVGWAQLTFRAPDPAAYLEAFGRVVADLPRETTPFLILDQGMAQIMAMVDSSDPEVIIGQLQPFADAAPLTQQQVVIAPYAAVMNMFPESPHQGRGEPVSRSVLTREITPGFASASADLINSGASHFFQIRTVGGAIADVPADATAYAHRDASFSLTVMGSNAQRLDRWFEPVRRQSDGLYLSFESGRGPARIADAFPPATLERLRRLKAELDPDNLFRDNFNIVPADTRSAS